jgi:hypothetical protein
MKANSKIINILTKSYNYNVNFYYNEFAITYDVSKI